MKIIPSLAIMHDDRRAERLPALQKKLGTHPDVCDSFVANGSRGGPWLALFKALFYGPKIRTHTIVIEDDAILCHNFIQGAINAIKSRPDDLLYLFASERQAGKEMAEARDAGCSWAEVNPYRTVGTVAACVPMTISVPFLDWACSKESLSLCSSLWPHKPWTGDSRLFYWMVNRHERSPLVCSMSLVDHDEDDPAIDSLIGSRQTKARRSDWFIGQKTNAGALDINSLVLPWKERHEGDEETTSSD